MTITLLIIGRMREYVLPSECTLALVSGGDNGTY